MSTRGYSARATGIVDAPVEVTFAFVSRADPTRFYPRFGPLPAVVAVHEQSGDWDAVGQTRRLELSDGGSVVETTRLVAPPERFRYRLTDFSGPFARLVAYADSDWHVTPAVGGSRVEWTYRYVPRRGAAALVALIVRLAWAPYMRRVLPGILAAAPTR